MNRLQENYKKEIVPALKQKLGLKNDLAVPKILKATVNIGVGKYKQDEKVVEEIAKDLALIAGQKPVYTQAKKAISTYKTRVGQQIGLKVTLRGRRLYDFIDRLVSLSLPRSRDFRGLSEKNIDGNGNLNIGIPEQIIFPEISHERVRAIFGLEISFTTNAKSRQEGLELFKLMGFPIKKHEEN